ncbi:uncharacterized protein LOC126702648 [Quercus robur]|uniref:uncharacterized protein LOC126702648 n=1 Tax=Quercus robur TaxID=38942 RepID=UPI002162E675|nr:uncharacterized protein LOC126702648 [Quercus robur]
MAGWLGIYIVIFTHASLPQGIMSSKVNRGLLLGLLLLTALSLAWSLFFTDENMKKLTEARDGKELFGVDLYQRSLSPFKVPGGAFKEPAPPPPRPHGSPGHNPSP